jgi:hypothetical protein
MGAAGSYCKWQRNLTTSSGQRRNNKAGVSLLTGNLHVGRIDKFLEHMGKVTDIVDDARHARLEIG